MVTMCWAAKGGSGTTVFAASAALAASQPTLLIDLVGDVPTVLGMPVGDQPGVFDWLRTELPAGRLSGLLQPASTQVSVLPSGERGPVAERRWGELVRWAASDHCSVLIDAGRHPPPALAEAVNERWLVIRPCYLALRTAMAEPTRPTGLVLVEEPGRALRADDLVRALGAPVIAHVLVDPAVARAVDAGLLHSRVPRGYRRVLRVA